jgi:hypothetical protein
MDGTGIPMRKSETEVRAGKQEDGSAKTREVKLVTVWSAQGRDKDGVPVRDRGSITHSASCANPGGGYRVSPGVSLGGSVWRQAGTVSGRSQTEGPHAARHIRRVGCRQVGGDSVR